MLLSRGLKNMADASAVHKVVDVESFFQSLGEDGAVSVPTAERLSAVAAAHRIYTNALSVMPFMVRRKEGAARSEPDHPLDWVLKVRSNPRMTPVTARKTMFSQAFWYGTGFGYIDRDHLGRVTGIVPLPSEGHQRYYDRETGAVWHSFSAPGDDPLDKLLIRKFQESELLIHHFETYDGVHGRGLLGLAKEAIRADAAAQKYNTKFYTNGARVSGIVEVAAELDDDARSIVREDFERMAHGMDNAFRVAVLDLGMKYTPLGISQRDSQYLETRAFSAEEVSRFTGIPAYMLQTGKQSYQSNEQQQIDFVTNTLLAPITQIEQEWGYKLLSPAELEQGYYLKLNVAALLRGDSKAQAEYYQRMIGMAVYSQDEVRALDDKSPLPDGLGGHYWISKNYDSVEKILAGEGGT